MFSKKWREGAEDMCDTPLKALRRTLCQMAFKHLYEHLSEAKIFSEPVQADIGLRRGTMSQVVL